MSELWDVCPCDRCEESRCEQAAFGWLLFVLVVGLVVAVVVVR